VIFAIPRVLQQISLVLKIAQIFPSIF
jgi:hypothetical protein